MKRGIRILGALLVCSIGVAQAQTQSDGKTHVLKAAPDTVIWGYYSPMSPPVLTVQSGDIVEVEHLVTGSGVMRALQLPEEVITPLMEEIQEKVKEEGGHLLVGPIAVEGAEPGDVLEIRILEMRPVDDWALNAIRPGSGAIPELFPVFDSRLIKLDRERNVALLVPGVEVPLNPFFGSIGVAPPVGRLDSGPPGFHAGNLDNKELVAGSTLYIPVHVKGALLNVGDGHVAQGDGEVNGLGLEASMWGKLQLIVRKDLNFRWPRAETPDYFITMGFDPDLDKAVNLALVEMIDYLVTERGLSRNDAYILCSVAVDFRVTQVVDGTKGIHAMLAKSLFVE